MTDSIKDLAREAQAASLGEDDTALLAMAEGLYNDVDGLSDEQQVLLVREALVRVSSLFDMIARANDAGTVAGLTAVGHTITGLAGYAIEEYREGLGHTSTGDKKVTEVLDGCRKLLGEFARQQMTQEQRDLSEAISDKVNARVAAGEPFSEAMAAEMAAHAKEREALAPAADQGEEVLPDRYSDKGMYL